MPFTSHQIIHYNEVYFKKLTRIYNKFLILSKIFLMRGFAGRLIAVAKWAGPPVRLVARRNKKPAMRWDYPCIAGTGMYSFLSSLCSS